MQGCAREVYEEVSEVVLGVGVVVIVIGLAQIGAIISAIVLARENNSAKNIPEVYWNSLRLFFFISLINFPNELHSFLLRRNGGSSSYESNADDDDL